MPAPMLDVNRQNQPLREEVLAAIVEVMDTGAFVNGPACKRFEAAAAEYCGVEHAVGCASGTDALLLALMAVGVGPGDEVIIPSFTFFATAGSVSRLGAKPVFADLIPATFNIDPADIEQKITANTRAIIPVHLFGQTAHMGAINDLAAKHQLPVIEDAAQAIGGEFQGKRAGSLGTIGCFSFYPTKNLGGMGDGGLVTTNDADLAAKIRVLCDHGQSPRYHHHLVGLNSRLDAMQAAALDIKLKHLDSYAAGRQRHAARYADELAEAMGVITPVEAAGCTSVWNQYTVRVEGGRRDELQKFLGEQKIGSAIYYPIPLHLQACFAELGYGPGDLPHTEQAAEEVLSLPVFPELAAEEQADVISAIQQFSAAGGSVAEAA